MQRHTDCMSKNSKVVRKVNSFYLPNKFQYPIIQSFKTLNVIHVRTYIGVVGITLNTDWIFPQNASDPMDMAAADRSVNFMFGWFLNPVMKGDYPDVMKKQIDRKSQEENLVKSRLPVFTEREKNFIRGRRLLFFAAAIN